MVLLTAVSLFAAMPEERNPFTPGYVAEKNATWLNGDGSLTDVAYGVLNAIRSDESLLCSKNRYGLDRIEGLVERAPIDPQSRRMLEEQFENIALLYRLDRQQGCLNPYAIYPEHIDIEKRSHPSASESENILLTRLLNALKYYESIDANGGWTPIQDDFYILKQGDMHRRVPAIRARLHASGDYNRSVDMNLTFDEALSDAVRLFQERHGLKSDGIVGPHTLKALNTPVSETIDRIRINIERLRWLTTGESDFILANIPDFTLTLYRDAQPVLSMKTVVGSEKRPTPMLSNTLTYAILNPYWRAPKTIVDEDILPKLKAGEFDYLERVGIVATRAADGNVTIDFRSVDWSQYKDSEDLPFIFLQKPGKENYLGFVKFMFPNDFDVYIHDTPHDELFSYKIRTKSSGCIRIEKPIELFHQLFNPNGDNGWRYKKIVEEILKNEEVSVGLSHPIPIYILYMTTYVDEEGRIYFYHDIYGYDKQMFDYINEYERDGDR